MIKRYKRKMRLSMKKQQGHNHKTSSSKLKRILIKICLVCFILGVITSITILHWISTNVRTMCKKAQSEYAGECVETLTQVLESESISFKEKNRVIWALGRIGDQRALPTLKKFDTGKPCPMKPCPGDSYICQYELKNAIDGCEKFNIIKYCWRWI